MTISIKSALGWTITEWVQFHLSASDDDSFNVLLELVNSQNTYPLDPAWISLVSTDELRNQWIIQQSRLNKKSLPLFGVPIAIKDNIDVKNMITTAACPSFAYEPEKDATAVKLLKEAGAIIIGKTNLDQFATGLVGVRSPYGKTACTFNDKYVSGGSSAGSASVVSRGIVPIALGTDTAGSGRVPAALNNIIGLKPTKGIISCSGVVPACKSLDCVSIFALNLIDAEKCLNILNKPDFDNDEYSRKYIASPPQKVPQIFTIAIPKHLPWYGDTLNQQLYSNSVVTLKSLGFVVKEIDYKPFLDLADCLYNGPWVAERYLTVKDLLQDNTALESFDKTVLKVIETAKNFDASDYFSFEYKRKKLLKTINKIFTEVDILCVPTCPLNPTFEQVKKEPIKINSYQGTWTNFVNLADLAALAIPSGFRSDGLPNGITLIGEKYTDYQLLDLANKFLVTLNKVNISKFGVFNAIDTNLESQFLQGPTNFTDTITVAVVGAHLKGLPLHWQLEQVNARFIKNEKTSKNYEIYVLPKTGPIWKPGLRRLEEESGNNIELEIYEIPCKNFAMFVKMIPSPLGIGSVELKNGDWVKSFICEEIGYCDSKSINITSFGGFKPYLEFAKERSDHLFDRILVANRGEIAVRIIKTLKRMNIESVAIYSEPDTYSQHVADADIKIPLNGTSVADTYVNIEKVIEAAKNSKADAIIPGYGFLSENAKFAKRCEEEGIVFVGPSSDTIKKLGLKHSAREIAKNAKVPLVPGSSLITSSIDAKNVANKLGYPIMVKSTAGGGGIGLQKADCEDDIETIFNSVQHQGKAYFGDSGVFLERFIDNARHVEIQIMGDGYGQAIALGERDCSLQRRNQKIVEETPAPRLPLKTRELMIEAAENLASSINYKSAGTVEYIYDENKDEFYFLEVNTRLQVEHPITELVTGLDLVEWMIRIAADKPPIFDRSAINFEGAAIEVRLYSENPSNNFLPSPGLIREVSFPSTARVDTWINKGTNVSTEYDPTLAKIIVHGKNRYEAILKMKDALANTKIYGCTTNLEYLKAIINSDMFETANVSTKVLNFFEFNTTQIEIIKPGAHTTIQDFPGRTKYWRIGVPRSGPMDSFSFRLANKLVGNSESASALEVTLTGPTIKFWSNTEVAITGGEVECLLDDVEVQQYATLKVNSGSVLKVGKLTTGCRTYISIKGGFDVPNYLGSQSTFTLGNFGGFNGRVLKAGDYIPLNSIDNSKLNSITTVHKSVQPVIPKDGHWIIGVTCGPHGSPDFFTKESVLEFFNSNWKVHYNSNRFGVKLIGPKPKWSRLDGGEAGLHPSNAHDYVYSIGAINFTGDEPVIITCDGPSLGGFVCQAVIIEAELWKVGQVKPGDFIKFVPVSYASARKLMHQQDGIINDIIREQSIICIDQLQLEQFENPVLSTLDNQMTSAPKVTYRQAGDHYILIEYGDNLLDFNYNYRILSLINLVSQYETIGVLEMSQGIRSVLVEFDCNQISQDKLLEFLISYESYIPFTSNWKVPSKILKLPFVFEDTKTLQSVDRYKETIRGSAPWLPNNVDFVAEVNQISRDDVESLMYSASFMVLGLGDVYLSSPCAVPLDPRQRLLGSKYNPARTYTERGSVGLGGMYMCIYAAASPGGYQLTGRTVPIWDSLVLAKHSKEPWVLSPFDQIQFYSVSEEELDQNVEEFDNGKFKLEIEETIFDHSKYITWLESNRQSIEDFQLSQKTEKRIEIANLIKADNECLKNVSPVIEPKFNIDNEDVEPVYSEFCGRFWKSLVKVGDEVKIGDTLVVIEAMKTEMAIVSTKDSKVIDILPNKGDMINSGDIVVVLE